MESVKHQIEYKRLDEIRPYDNNPRRNDEAAKAVANSIKEFGFQSPIIVDRDGVIIAGHTRYKAARRLKLQEVPVIVAAELDPEKVKALRIADNSTGEVAEWDLQLLVQELTGIDYDMADFGLNLQIKIDEEVKEDDFTAEPPEQPVTQRGDIWLLGDHRVMCGDSTSPQDVEQLMDGQLADLLLTDPPYNVNYEGANGKKIENDNMAESQFRQFLLQAYSRAFEACTGVWSGSRTASFSATATTSGSTNPACMAGSPAQTTTLSTTAARPLSSTTQSRTTCGT